MENTFGQADLPQGEPRAASSATHTASVIRRPEKKSAV